MSSESDDGVPPAPVYERRRRGAVAVACDAPLTSKQHDDVRQAIWVSLGPKRAGTLLKIFAEVKTITMAQRFLSSYESELGLLGRIQAATALSTSLASTERDINRMQGTPGMEGGGDTVPVPSEEAKAAEKAAVAEAEHARAALKEEQARRRTLQLAAAKRRAARKALSSQSRAALAAKETQLALAQNRLQELDRRLNALANEEAVILRQLESGQLTAEKQAVLRHRLEKLGIEKQRLTSQQAKLRSKIAHLQADIETILTGNMDQLATDGVVDEREQTAGDQNAADLNSQRNPYEGTRFDPGKFRERLGASGLAFGNPLQCPAPPPEPKRRPGSALLVDRSPSAEDRLEKYRQLLASERQVRHAELQHNQPSAAVLCTIKAARRWQRITGALKRRYRLRGPGFDSCLRLPGADLGQTVSDGAISAARNVWCGTSRTHPFFELPKKNHSETHILTERQRCSIRSTVPAAVSYALWHQSQRQSLGSICYGELSDEGKRKHEPSPPECEQPHGAPTRMVDHKTRYRSPQFGACVEVRASASTISSAAETNAVDANAADPNSKLDVWHAIEHQIKREKEERQLRMEERCRANVRNGLFQTGGTVRGGRGSKGVGSSAHRRRHSQSKIEVRLAKRLY